MSLLHKPEDALALYGDQSKTDKNVRKHRTTPLIITFCETVVTEFDIHGFIELGLRVVRFKMTDLTKSAKIEILSLLDQALKWCCDKYNVSAWPVALSIDIPNAVIKTGFIANTEHKPLCIRDNSIVEVTSDPKYWTKCDEHRIFVDDPYTMPNLVPGTEITIDFGSIVMTCTERIDVKNILCKVLRGGNMNDLSFVCFRGIKIIKPILTKKDMDLINFAKEFKFDIVSINSVRRPDTVQKIRNLFGDHKPLLMSTICEQEGLDRIDEIIEVSDGIILAREFLAHAIKNKYKMLQIQLHVGAKCKKRGKPFYLSGNVMEGTLFTGGLKISELNDVTNAVLQGSGFVMRKFKDPAYLFKALSVINDVCRAVEPLTRDRQFWRMMTEYKPPVNAAEAAVLSCILLAKVTQSSVIIVPTVTGRTIKQIVHMSSDAIIIAITSDPLVARQLQLYRGVVAIIYDKKDKQKNWATEMNERIKFAVAYGMKFEVLQFGSRYVVLRKSLATSSYCDNVSSMSVLTEEQRIHLKLKGKSQHFINET